MRPDPSGDPRDLAAAWFAYLQSSQASEADRRAFEQWRHAHPEHARQYRNVARIWDATQAIPEGEWREMLARSETSRARPDMGRRRLGWALAGICSAALVGGVALRGGWLAAPRQVLTLASARGQRRQVPLPDGSVLDLNTGTRAVVRFHDDRREIALLDGEVFFAVEHDADVPFIVEAGGSRVRVTGTRFNVRYDGLTARVSVESGSVEVSGGPWWRRRSRSLAAGQGIDVRDGQEPGEVGQRDLGTTLAWQRGKIVFENTPLAQAVDEINRYLAAPARLDAPSLRAHRVAGIFSVDDPQALLDMLPEIAPVRVYRLQDGQARIVAR
ncbi:Iron siderophore sensor protein [plant metagenome]|uniref:Iron siderophore sensor protein n=1 Tax=plant metagenome TaxID=1297885 RepID=A0A484XZV6_9ZZZZ